MVIRPEPLTITNLIARKVSERCQLLRWDNDQYETLCGYRLAFATEKSGKDLWSAEWQSDLFPKESKYHYLLIWIEGMTIHSAIYLRLSATSPDRHGYPCGLHLAGWYEVQTKVGDAEKRDPSAPVVLVSDPDRPELPALNIFEHNGQLNMNVNCSPEEIVARKYMQISEWVGERKHKVSNEYIRRQKPAGRRASMSFPSRVDDMVVDVPSVNPEIVFRFVGEDLWIKPGGTTDH